MSEFRPIHADATLPANSGVTPGTTTTLVTAVAGQATRVFDVVFAIASAGAGGAFTLVEIGNIAGGVTKKFALNANNPTVTHTFPCGLDTGDNVAVTARVMGNGGGVACQCSIDYARILPA